MTEPITTAAAAVSAMGALPMPMGTEPQVLSVSEQQIEALADAGNRAVNDAAHEDLCMCDGWPEKCSSSGGYFQGYWDMGGLETAIPAVLASWERMRGGELEQLRTRIAVLERQAEIVAGFVAKRAEYITNLRNCNPDNAHDYDRWQGHAAARRQLAQELGLPVAWPAEDRERAEQLTRLVPVEDPHDSPLSHRYRVSHDRPDMCEPGGVS